jgi:hypothetical protein
MIQQTEATFALRKLTMDELVAGVNEANLPIVFTGTRAECELEALKSGYKWMPSRKEWIGGFWYKSPQPSGRQAESMFMRKVES